MDNVFRALGETVVVSPLLLVFLLGGSSLLGKPFPERVIGRLVHLAVAVGLAAAIAMLGLMLAFDQRHISVELGNWVQIHGHDVDYHFSVKFLFDRLSVPFVILTFVLCGTIGQFGIKYMHRESGFNRFFSLYALFMLGMTVTSLAGTIETLFAGWELVGLSSALLVAFYHDRLGPVTNGLRVWIVYRISDAALLFASVALHHMTGGGDFDLFLGDISWPEGVAAINPRQGLLVGSLLLIAAAGKSALVPFSGWLPRAMEGPTPSSAVFYGALSVHLGCFLLLRCSPILDLSWGLSACVVALGLVSAIFSAFACRVQTDIKSALSFASMTQVGIITAEIGAASLISIFYSRSAGETLRYLTLIHILGHGCLRTLQFVRAPTLLYDYRLLENALGRHLPHQVTMAEKVLPTRARTWFYRLALERGYLDALLTTWIVRPIIAVFRKCDDLERRWLERLSGEHNPPTHTPDADGMPTRTLEEMV
ncbi:MAG: proton-conducting transporter membrane subunit [Pirellulales bacterium]